MLINKILHSPITIGLNILQQLAKLTGEEPVGHIGCNCLGCGTLLRGIGVRVLLGDTLIISESSSLIQKV